MENKIEFYKDRTLSERFSVSADFLRQNWKVFLRNIVYIGIPLAILTGFFYPSVSLNPEDMVSNPTQIVGFIGSYILFMLFTVVFSLYIYSMTGSILRRYENEGILSPALGWSDLKEDCFSIMAKTFVQGLIITLILFAIILVIGFIAGLSATAGSALVSVFIMFIFVIGMFAVIPGLCLITYPVIFKNTSAFDGIKQGLRLGLKYWGSTFLTCLLGGILVSIVSTIFGLPLLIYNFILPGGSGFVGYILSALMYLPTVITSPMLIIYLAFQYTSLIEKEEGISLTKKVDDFDTL